MSESDTDKAPVATVDGEPEVRTDAASLSTQPAPPAARPVRGHGPLVWVRRGWRRLTSMRTALVLLFLLALAAVPGSLLPQRPLNPAKVSAYLADHPTLGPFLDRIGMFDVFASSWFAAIYLLLFISLVGCLVPRLRLHARALRSAPPKAPRRFDRLPESTTYDSEADAETVVADWTRALRRGRWRVTRRELPDGTLTLSAEKGYLRETGNLVFHLSLTALLIGLAIGRLWGYQGAVLIEEGKGFCNVTSQYDQFRPGRQVRDQALAPFCLSLDSFTATYEPDGTPSLYRADIQYSEGVDGERRPYQLKVNEPLRIQGVRVYLIDHGFSPRFTITTPDGQTFGGVSAPFLSEDGNWTSTGALKLPDASPRQIGIEGIFAPTAAVASGNLFVSVNPEPNRPGLSMFVYEGDLGLDSGEPQSVYTLDRDQIASGALRLVEARSVVPGEVATLEDGTTIRFDGYNQWASVKVSRDPGQTTVLFAAAFVVLGLLLSLGVRRRRLWVRATPTDEPDNSRLSVVEVGGLARTDSGRFTTEFTRLVDDRRPDGRTDNG